MATRSYKERKKAAREQARAERIAAAKRAALSWRSSKHSAGSSGRCNTSIKSLGWGCKFQSLAWSFVELPSHFVELGLRVHGQVSPLRQVLPQQTVGILAPHAASAPTTPPSPPHQNLEHIPAPSHPLHLGFQDKVLRRSLETTLPIWTEKLWSPDAKSFVGTFCCIFHF